MEPFAREKDILLRALALEGPARNAFLDTACAGDPELRRRIDRLLVREAEIPAILATAGAAELFQPRGDEQTGGRAAETVSIPSGEDPLGRIGPYRLLRVLGEGGMGTVYLAQQESPIRRTVALKLIKLGMDTREVVQRFLAERQAMALMDHPHIAKVLDAGTTETGRPYFVMEYVAGVPITEYCDHHRLDTDARLRIFAEVCQAVHHAHQNGIIHRDVKPTNVLVTLRDGQPSPKIIDFGVAKAIEHRPAEHTLFTEEGQLVGTPEYMSPEQAEMTASGVDATTDVYSLGVLLYELLTGVPPFDFRELRAIGIDAIRRKIREDSPPRPSTRVGTIGESGSTAAAHRRTSPGALARRMRGDLDWITMRAMDKDRARRYASASELAADVLRHLRHEPAVAGPPTFGYILSKLVKRHRVLFISIGAVGLALAGGLVASTALYLRAESARQIATAERERAERQAAKADRVARFQVEMLEKANPYRAPDARELTVREVLETAERDAGAALNEEPDVQAALWAVVGESYRAIGRYNDAERVLRKAVEILEQVHGRDSPETSATLASLGSTLVDAGRVDEAEPLLEEALAIRRSHFGPMHALTAAVLTKLAAVALHRDEFTKADSLDRAALEIRRAVLGPAHPDVAQSLNNLGAIRDEMGDDAGAEQYYRQALEIWGPETGAIHPDATVTMTNLGIILRRMDRFEEAEAIYRRSLELQRKIFDGDHVSIVRTLNSLAVVLQETSHEAEASSALEESIAMLGRLFPGDHPQTAVALNNLGQLRYDQDRLLEADSLLSASLDMRRRLYGSDHLDVATALNNLARVRRTRELYDEATALFQESIAIRTRALGKDHIQVAAPVSNLSGLLRSRALATDDPALRAEYLSEAEALARRSLAIRRAHRAGDHSSVATGLMVLAQVLHAQDRYQEAQPLYEEALEMERQIQGDRSQDQATILVAYGDLLLDRGRAADAAPVLEEGLRVRESRHPAGDWRIGWNCSSLGRCYGELGRWAEAESLLVEGLRMLEASPRAPSNLVRRARERVATFHERRERP